MTSPGGSLFEGRELACIRGERIVFTGLNFTLAPGGALLLTGPNGSGKSSLLRLMAGLTRPAMGQLHWDGKAVAEDPEAHGARLQFVGHLEAVKPVLSVEENLMVWAGLRGAGREAVRAALDRAGLAAFAEVPGRLLSAGQKRRLALARLLAAPAQLWLLDEPTVGLDQAAIGRLVEAFAAQRAGGGSVVVTSHVEVDLPGHQRLDLAAFQASAMTGFPQ